MSRFFSIFIVLALVLTGCSTSSKRASDVAIESHGFFGPWGDKHMPLVVLDAGHGGFELDNCEFDYRDRFM